MNTTDTPTKPLSQRITQGPVTSEGGTLYIKQSPSGMLTYKAYVGTSDNAELIAEAFNVTHETGRTPRQLADERAELIAKLRDMFNISTHPKSTKEEIRMIAREAAQLLTRLQS